MLRPWFAWLVLVLRISRALSGAPPVITDFPSADLIKPEDVLSDFGFRLPCKAVGSTPLQHKWKLNGQDIETDFHFNTMKDGTLKGRYLDDTHSGIYQCFVKNSFGEDFSRKLKVGITVAGQFHYDKDKNAPVTLGKPIEIPCPNHDPSFGVSYRWGFYDSSDPYAFYPLPEDNRTAVTMDGTLVIMFVTKEDVKKVNGRKGIACEMSISEVARYSHVVKFQLSGNESTEKISPVIYFAPKHLEEAREGYPKKLYCLAVAKPSPKIIWWKDGKKIGDNEYEYSLPRENFNRLLFIDKVTSGHQGNYTCTAVSASGKERVSASTYLTVKASPEWKVRFDRKIQVQRSKNLSLMLIADGVPSPSYQWLRNGKEIDASESSRAKIEKNKLHLMHVDSWHDAVFQCVAENDQGMIVSSVWVDVEDSPTSVAPSSRSGFFSDNAPWIILTALLGVLFIVAVIVIIILYKRRKAREHGERSDATEETPRYLDVCQSNSSAPKTNATEVAGGKRPRRHATLPPLPQYQALDLTTTPMPSYESIDAEQDLNDSGLYEKLDFRSMKSGHEYVNPERPIPEYLELVNDAQVPPGNTTSNAQTKGLGKSCYVSMENGESNNVLNNSSPQDYVLMENGMHSRALNNSTPQDYVPMDASNMRNNPSLPMTGRSDGSTVETGDRTSLGDYYQPMANNGGSSKQGNPQTSPLGDYYSPMAGNTLSGPASSANAQDEVMSSKL